MATARKHLTPRPNLDTSFNLNSWGGAAREPVGAGDDQGAATQCRPDAAHALVFAGDVAPSRRCG
ncbi:hypothetical protein ACFYNY_25080 [Streptomyces sp. NPDC006530]|uniref:hypothetical protein n=1 Tax=Streptomyces sp. NPDC006530 TaxID=3364750 RepID=UPI00368F1BE6